MLAAIALVVPAGASAAGPADVEIAGNQAPGLAAADRLGAEDGSAGMTVQLALRLRNQAELEQRARAVNDPRSADFGHYLQPREFAARYAPTAQQVERAVGFLRAAGLHVTSVSANSLLVNASGRAAAVARAFGTGIGRYRDRHTGLEFFANDAAPRLPADVGALVQGVHGLDHHYQLRRSHVTFRPDVGAGPAGGYTPAQLRTAYGLTAAPLTSFDGAGQTIGVFELDGYDPANIGVFDRQYFNPLPPAPVRVPVDGGAATTQGGQIEVELDIEVAQAIAPGVTVVVYDAPNTNAGTNDAYSAMVAGGARANSTSWGLCEAAQGPSETNTLHSIFTEAAAQGQAIFAASGDSGAYDCYDPTATSPDYTPAVDSPSSDPFVTSVGGTRLTLNSNSTYGSETAWGTAGPPTPQGSGGGNSSVYAEPSWQAASHRPENASSMRQVPDVALDGDPQTGYSVYTVRNGRPQWTVVGGTSAGAPAWAAFAVIYDQYACAGNRAGLGNANPQLYGVAGGTPYPYNDVTAGNSGTAGLWNSGAGWDYATGLGTLRAGDVASALAAGAPPGSAPPHINRVGPGPRVATGPPLGGNIVDIYGCGFGTDAGHPPAVRFGGNPSPSVTWFDTTHLQAVVPAHNGGLVDVAVTNPAGPAYTSRGSYLYTATTGGYSILTAAGAIYSFGSATYHGNLLDGGFPGPAVGLAATPDGGGYNILNSGGGIYSFGNASYFGNLIDGGFPGPAVAIAYTPTGQGYSILTRSGGIYSFGDAQAHYYGNLIDHGYPGTAASVAFTATGNGYLILTTAGAIYSFGDASYYGNLLDHRYPGVAVSLNMTRSGGGYSILTTAGALYSFGDAPYFGNLLDHRYPGPATAISDTP